MTVGSVSESVIVRRSPSSAPTAAACAWHVTPSIVKFTYHYARVVKMFIMAVCMAAVIVLGLML